MMRDIFGTEYDSDGKPIRRMPREKKVKNCEHCGLEFTQARKDQRYCKAECRFDHFFEKRDNEKAVMDKQIETLKARVSELEALQTAQTVPTPPTPTVPIPKRTRPKALAP
jgi:hypothetical protein